MEDYTYRLQETKATLRSGTGIKMNRPVVFHNQENVAAGKRRAAKGDMIDRLPADSRFPSFTSWRMSCCIILFVIFIIASILFSLWIMSNIVNQERTTIENPESNMMRDTDKEGVIFDISATAEADRTINLHGLSYYRRHVD